MFGLIWFPVWGVQWIFIDKVIFDGFIEEGIFQTMTNKFLQ